MHYAGPKEDASRDTAGISQTLPKSRIHPFRLNARLCCGSRAEPSWGELRKLLICFKGGSDPGDPFFFFFFLAPGDQEHSVSRNHSSRRPCLLKVVVPPLFPGSETKQLLRRRGLGWGRTQRKMFLEEADSSEAARLASRGPVPWMALVI